MYKPIDQWFGSPNKNIKPLQKTVFYLDSTTMQSNWLHDKPEKSIIISIVKWNKIPIILCTNLKQNHKYGIPTENMYTDKHITFLKSTLQKCVRRQLNEKAVKVAYHFIKININEFIRRLSIIILEDVILHESYSTLVWLIATTSSTKNIFKPNKQIIDWLLGYVDTLCNISDADKMYNNKNNEPKKYNITDFNDYDILYSLQFRSSYGGMGCDVDMINYYIEKWFTQFKKDNPCNNALITSIDSSTIKPFIIDDWKLKGDNMAGIDFHCAPYILEILSKQYNYTSNEVKSAIWNCSSKINTRKINYKTDKNKEVWNKIKHSYYELQFNILNKSLKKYI